MAVHMKQDVSEPVRGIPYPEIMQIKNGEGLAPSPIGFSA
jgi:hypothetical protein